MAVVANHLYAAVIWAEKTRLQMQVMIELDGSRIGALGSQRGEFGMIAFKAGDITYKTGGSPARRKVRVTLRAVCIACGGQPNRSAMIGVAGSARGREGLRYVMHGTVMARKALLIDDLCVVKTQVGHMAGGALPRQNRM